ncbi:MULTISPECIES: hypothetical protein [Pseudomonas]|uniref:hypothetical protein n=1 Tax=Pseudomonas TaxID=286 RepID=UPI001577193D|nr:MULTISPECIES: hypothetical protein [Pseudomonas]MBP5100644.1 hypothetical protein [Pseudomonas protegens]MDT9644419.1 hypothetical protein [Pseudomonas sp. JV245A]NTZ75607.1 hypothetical protein [Pseudomonas protegens]QTU05617.1 hypothetical protein HUT25_07575 [Pseudomonas protegens]QTU11928.1 hypothetical protein HUT23_08265 [Pseudomonas protegens]
MSFINVVEYGIVIRRQELISRFIDIDRLSALLEFDAPLDINADVVSFGPCFGGEAADELTRRLEVLGLQYVDDFFVFSGEFPLWCKFKVGIKSD